MANVTINPGADLLDVLDVSADKMNEGTIGAVVNSGLSAGTNIALGYNAGTGKTTISVSAGSVSDLNIPVATTSGTATALVATYTPAPSAPTAGRMVTFIAHTVINLANATTFNPNGLGAVAMLNKEGVASGVIPSGTLVLMEHDGTQWRVLAGINGDSNLQIPIGTTAGTATALTLSAGMATTVLTAGRLVSFIAHTDVNLGAATTLNVNGLGAINLRSVAGTLRGYIASGTMCIAEYDGTNWRVVAGADMVNTVFTNTSGIIGPLDINTMYRLLYRARVDSGSPSSSYFQVSPDSQSTWGVTYNLSGAWSSGSTQPLGDFTVAGSGSVGLGSGAYDLYTGTSLGGDQGSAGHVRIVQNEAAVVTMYNRAVRAFDYVRIIYGPPPGSPWTAFKAVLTRLG